MSTACKGKTIPWSGWRLTLIACCYIWIAPFFISSSNANVIGPDSCNPNYAYSTDQETKTCNPKDATVKLSITLLTNLLYNQTTVGLPFTLESRDENQENYVQIKHDLPVGMPEDIRGASQEICSCTKLSIHSWKYVGNEENGGWFYCPMNGSLGVRYNVTVDYESSILTETNQNLEFILDYVFSATSLEDYVIAVSRSSLKDDFDSEVFDLCGAIPIDDDFFGSGEGTTIPSVPLNPTTTYAPLVLFPTTTRLDKRTTTVAVPQHHLSTEMIDIDGDLESTIVPDIFSTTAEPLTTEWNLDITSACLWPYQEKVNNLVYPTSSRRFLNKSLVLLERNLTYAGDRIFCRALVSEKGKVHLLKYMDTDVAGFGENSIETYISPLDQLPDYHAGQEEVYFEHLSLERNASIFEYIVQDAGFVNDNIEGIYLFTFDFGHGFMSQIAFFFNSDKVFEAKRYISPSGERFVAGTRLHVSYIAPDTESEAEDVRECEHRRIMEWKVDEVDGILDLCPVTHIADRSDHLVCDHHAYSYCFRDRQYIPQHIVGRIDSNDIFITKQDEFFGDMAVMATCSISEQEMYLKNQALASFLPNPVDYEIYECLYDVVRNTASYEDGLYRCQFNATDYPEIVTTTTPQEQVDEDSLLVSVKQAIIKMETNIKWTANYTNADHTKTKSIINDIQIKLVKSFRSAFDSWNTNNPDRQTKFVISVIDEVIEGSPDNTGKIDITFTLVFERLRTVNATVDSDQEIFDLLTELTNLAIEDSDCFEGEAEIEDTIDITPIDCEKEPTELPSTTEIVTTDEGTTPGLTEPITTTPATTSTTQTSTTVPTTTTTSTTVPVTTTPGPTPLLECQIVIKYLYVRGFGDNIIGKSFT